jgi:Spy/CpxP family protein refolding chaperone
MLKVLSTVVTLFASLVVVGGLLAADGPGPEGNRPPRPPRMDPIGMMLRGITLTDAQKPQVEELKKEYGPKYKEAFGKLDDILTDEQKKARKAAVKEAKEAGKEPWDVHKAGRDAVQLTDEQKKKMAENWQKNAKARQALDKEVREKLLKVLTPEQAKQLKKNDRHGKRRDGPPGGGPGPEGGPPPEGGRGPEGGPPPEVN